MGYNWQFHIIGDYWPVFFHGAIVTLEITFASILLGLVLGLPTGIARMARRPLWRIPASTYVEFIRATPALVQIVWIYYCFPILFGVRLEAKATIIVALGVHSGAYVAEIVRAGINSIERGQFMAAQSIGMSYFTALHRIILPQAVRKMIPPFINEFANVMKLSTLGSVIAVYELLQESNNLIAATYRPMEIYTFLALVFFAITFPWIWLSRRLEQRLQRQA
jgi:polar amino acid transport system permease protein